MHSRSVRPVGSGVGWVVVDVGRRIEDGLDDLTVSMTDHFTEVIPEFRHDEAVRRLMVASTESNLHAVAAMLVHDIPLSRITVPAAAAQYARRFAQHRLPLEALLRAYRLGENSFVQQCLAVMQELDHPADMALASTARIAQMVNSYVDRVIEGLVAIYDEERLRWDRRSDLGRAAQVRAVLDDWKVDAWTAEQMIGYRLDRWHLAGIVWAESNVPDPQRSLAGVAGLVGEVAAHPLHTVFADECTLWLWLAPAVNVQLGSRRGAAASYRSLAPDQASYRIHGASRVCLILGYTLVSTREELPDGWDDAGP